MNFGIVGYGRMGRVYHETLESMKHNVEFVCDVEQKSETTNFFNDYKTAIDSSSIDGLIVSTYGPTHHEIVKYAIKKGIKYIVCEKPFTTSVTHAQEILQLLQNSSTMLTVSYLRRFSGAYSNLMDRLYKDQIIGEPRSVIITSGAGGISTLGTHFLDLCTYLLADKVESVFGVPVNNNLPNPRGKQFEDPGGYFVLNLRNQKRAFVDMGDDVGIQPRIEIIGSFGRVQIDEVNKKIMAYSRNPEKRKESMRLYGLENELVINESFNFEPISVLVERMLENITSGRDLRVTAEMAKDKVEIYSALRKSFDIGLPVRLPLDGEYYNREFMVT